MHTLHLELQEGRRRADVEQAAYVLEHEEPEAGWVEPGRDGRVKQPLVARNGPIEVVGVLGDLEDSHRERGATGTANLYGWCSIKFFEVESVLRAPTPSHDPATHDTP